MSIFLIFFKKSIDLIKIYVIINLRIGGAIMSRTLEMQRKRQKKEQQQDIILFSMLVIGLISMIILSIKLGKEDMKSCINAGHSVKYCERGL